MINYIQRGSINIIALGLLLGVAGIASADEVSFVGSTLGQFNAQAFGTTNSLLDLHYSNSTFNNITVGNALDLGGNPSPGSNVDNLGSFDLGLTNATYNGNTFSVKVTFTAPSTIVGGNSAVFTDIITGTVSGGQGGVLIDFDNTPQTFFFTNALATGSFTMFVNDVSIAPGGKAAINGHITASQTAVPEPAALAGLGCGLLGLFGMRRKRRA
ncbi:MAG: PEP-CTERM sorting domain-containing protein [Armatimonadota bacterium]